MAVFSMQSSCTALGQPASYFVTASQSLNLPSIVIPLYTASLSSSLVSSFVSPFWFSSFVSSFFVSSFVSSFLSSLESSFVSSFWTSSFSTSTSRISTVVPANVSVKSESAKNSIGITASTTYGAGVLRCASLTTAISEPAISPFHPFLTL